jgi:hypothetical protein
MAETTDRERRLEELKAKTDGISDAEMAELIALSPPGTFTKLPNLATAGLKDMGRALANFVEVGDRVKRALDEGFYVEVLALRSQSLELYLRVYLAAHHQMAPSFPVDDRKTLGALIAEAAASGLEPDLCADLKAFNASRITGLHHFLLGAATYDDLRGLCENSKGLVQRVVAALSNRFGQPA